MPQDPDGSLARGAVALGLCFQPVEQRETRAPGRDLAPVGDHHRVVSWPAEEDIRVGEYEVLGAFAVDAYEGDCGLRAARVGDVAGVPMLGGELVDRVGEDARQVTVVFRRQPAQQGAAEAMGVPRDPLMADRLGAGDAGAVEQHRRARHRADEVLVRAATAGTRDHHHVHSDVSLQLMRTSATSGRPGSELFATYPVP